MTDIAAPLADEAFGLLRKLDAFDDLDVPVLRRFAERAREVRVSPGEIIVREGDHGDLMYVVASGSVQVLGRAFDGSVVVLARLEAGSFFGEQALLTRGTSRRNATVRAVTSCRMLVLTRDDLTEALAADSALAAELHAAATSQHELRRIRLREDVLRNIGVGEGYRIERFASGAVVFRQGDAASRVYLVLAGEARVTRHGESDEVLACLLPGQFFGELAILHDAPRGATVEATEELEVASIDGAWFRNAHAENPQLRSVMQTLESMYVLPRRGLLTLQAGHLGTHPTITAIHDLPDGRRVVTSHLVEQAAFTSRVLGAPEATQAFRFEDLVRGVLRELHLADGRIVELEVEGEWPQLGDVLELLLDGAPVDEALLSGFEAAGELGVAAAPPSGQPELVCRCARVTSGEITRAMESGCHTVEQVARATRATLVCGGCVPVVRELLGQADWTPARCECVIPITEDVRTFRIRPMKGPCHPWLPGQHLVIQARIDQNWVQRPYTLSCPHGPGDAYEITVKREPEGVFSRWLFDRLRGDSLLRVSRPAGSYHLPADPARDVVCLVSGIGVTPALAMARALGRTPRGFRLHLDYSVSHDDAIVCREELEALANASTIIKLRITSRDGRLSRQEVQALARVYPDADYYLCGSAGYMSSMRTQLSDAGVAPERVRVETFVVAGERPRMEEIELAGSLHELPAIAPTDRLPILRALVVIASCDGRIADEERTLIDALAERYQLSPDQIRNLYDLASSHPTLDDARLDELSPSGQRTVLGLAAVLVYVDGTLYANESSALASLCKRLPGVASEALLAAGEARARRIRELL